jgi:Tol biopolymer transport system component
MTSDGTRQQQLTRTARSAVTRSFRKVIWSDHPSYSPDGTKIVYSSTQSGNSEIWVMNADGTKKTQLTFPGKPAAPDANAPAWSPDGKKIAFWSGYVREYGEIWVINSDGTGRRQLTFMNGVNSDYTKLKFNSDEASWSPDGKYIIFNSNGRSAPNWTRARTWIMGSDGSNPMVLFPFAHGASSRPWRAVREP